MYRLMILQLFVLSSLAWPHGAAAHAVPERAEPGAGAVLERAPATVTIHFDARLEPFFSKVVVTDERGVKVSLGDGELAAGDTKALSVRLVTAGKGNYRVHWDVVSHDGHRARGDYSFTVR